MDGFEDAGAEGVGTDARARAEAGVVCFLVCIDERRGDEVLIDEGENEVQMALCEEGDAGAEAAIEGVARSVVAVVGTGGENDRGSSGETCFSDALCHDFRLRERTAVRDDRLCVFCCGVRISSDFAGFVFEKLRDFRPVDDVHEILLNRKSPLQ